MRFRITLRYIILITLNGVVTIEIRHFLQKFNTTHELPARPAYTAFEKQCAVNILRRKIHVWKTLKVASEKPPNL